MGQAIRILLAVLVIGGITAGGYELYRRRTAAPVGGFRAVELKRGDVLATITATGTLEPEEVVDVGAQVAGQIKTLGKDAHGKQVDYNSEVEEGLVLANIDDSLYQADLNQANAQVASAEANVAKAEADVKQFQAKLRQAQRDWERAQKTDKNVLSPADVDAFQAAYESALANIESANAAVRLAKAGVTSANAVKDRAERNLSYCIIKSPVKGVIISRRVNIGQTVVSSLNAPSLFLIAKDLTRIQIWASVNEADIGNVHPGQSATFTVDEVANGTFQGTVGKVRMDAQTTQNVVTYTVEINVDNSNRALRPYSTANVQFEKEKRQNVLYVPNVALRWMPSSLEQVVPEARDSMSNGTDANGGGGGGRKGAGASGGGAGGGAGAGNGPTSRPASGAPKHGTIWVQDGNYARPIKVRIGVSDTTNTEVSSPDLKEGMQVITAEVRPDDTTADGRNPFIPQFKRR